MNLTKFVETSVKFFQKYTVIISDMNALYTAYLKLVGHQNQIVHAKVSI